MRLAKPKRPSNLPPCGGFEADLPIEPVARSSAEKAGEIAEQSGSPANRQDRGGRRRAPAFAVALAATLTALPALATDLPAGFVYLSDIDPTIRQDMRYAGSE